MDDLIEIVRQYKVIHDTKCKEYRDQSIRASVWEEIGEKIKQPPEKCKDNWNKLRSCYVNALKCRKNKKSGQAAQFVPPWKYEERMSFLQPYMESRSTTTNLSSPPESPEFHSDSTQSDKSRPATPHTGSSSHSRQPVRKPTHWTF
nr:transcription factor Adf-1-like [Helicoverpa armigera]